MKNKSFYLLLGWALCFPFSTIISQGSWEKVDVPTTKNLYSVFFIDSLTGWAVGDSGTIIHTTDGANTWSIQDSQTENEIIELFFLNENMGWASSYKFNSLPYGTLLLKTTDGGQNWSSEMYPEDNIFIRCILFLDSLNGWMGGNPHTLVKTTNGGQEWQKAYVDTSTLAFFPVLSIQFFDDNYGYASGGMFDIAGVIWRTTNGGETWYALDPEYAPADEVHQLHLFDSLHVLGAGGDPDFGYGVAYMRTQDGGITWDYEELGIQGNAFDLDFRTDSEAWCPLGPRKKLIYSLDSGSTWSEIPTPDSTSIFDVIFPDSLHGYAVGRDGAFIRYVPAVPVSIQSRVIPNENGLLLIQNYPNPFNSKTRIKFNIPSSVSIGKDKIELNCTSVKLKIYNSLGKVKSFFEYENSDAGLHYIDYDATSLPGGVYYYQLNVSFSELENPVSESKRMILIKD